MTARASAKALCRSAASNDDVLAIVDRAMMFAASDYSGERALRQRLAILNDVAPVALLGAGDTGHLPRPARALATLIDRATYDEDDWLWMRRTLRSLQLDPGALLVETRAALPVAETRSVAEFQPNPNDYVLFEVARLPFAHNPFKCEYADVHRAFEQQNRQRGRRNAWLRRFGRGQQELPDVAAGRQLNDCLATGSLTACGKHEHLDWAAAMLDASRIRDTTMPWTPENISDALGITTDEESTFHQRFVRDLFVDPVRWDGKNPRVNNGQHRICGARLAGVPKLMIAMREDERY